MTARDLNRATLARQFLLDPVTMPPTELVAHLVGMQGQAPLAPYFGLWSRLATFDPATIGDALHDRTLVRIVTLRGTVHLHTREDAHTIRALTQPMLERMVRGTKESRDLLTRVPLDDLLAHGRTLLGDAAASLTALRPALMERWPGEDPLLLSRAINYALPLVQIPPRGVWGQSGQPVLALIDRWTGEPLVTEPDLATIIRRYLAAFGPATVQDAQTWSGLTRLRDTFERLRPELVTFRDEAGRELFDLPEAPRPDASVDAPVRILAPFDNILLSHADRARIISEPFRKRLQTRNGIVPHTILIDGMVAGSAALTTSAKQATLTITPFTEIGMRDRDALEDEAYRLLTFAAPEATTREIAIT